MNEPSSQRKAIEPPEWLSALLELPIALVRRYVATTWAVVTVPSLLFETGEALFTEGQYFALSVLLLFSARSLPDHATPLAFSGYLRTLSTTLTNPSSAAFWEVALGMIGWSIGATVALGISFLIFASRLSSIERAKRRDRLFAAGLYAIGPFTVLSSLAMLVVRAMKLRGYEASNDVGGAIVLSIFGASSLALFRMVNLVAAGGDPAEPGAKDRLVALPSALGVGFLGLILFAVAVSLLNWVPQKVDYAGFLHVSDDDVYFRECRTGETYRLRFDAESPSDVSLIVDRIKAAQQSKCGLKGVPCPDQRIFVGFTAYAERRDRSAEEATHLIVIKAHSNVTQDNSCLEKQHRDKVANASREGALTPGMAHAAVPPPRDGGAESNDAKAVAGQPRSP